MKRKKDTQRTPVKIELEIENSERGTNRRGSRSTSKTSYVLDLRVNSPTGNGFLNIEGLSSAPAMVRLSKVKGLDVIAITDLYSGAFIDELVSAARSSHLTVIPGVSLRCRVGLCNDIIISCLFSEKTRGADVESFLRDLQIPTAARGNMNFVVAKTLDQILHTLERYGGVAIPTRVDKTPTRLSVLGELIETYGFRAFDLAYYDSKEIFERRWPKYTFQLFSFSDAYGLAQIGSRSAKVRMPVPGFEGIKQIVARA
jgi:hypothetical protein